jgi:hypothetical protein
MPRKARLEMPGYCHIVNLIRYIEQPLKAGILQRLEEYPLYRHFLLRSDGEEW